MPEMNLRQPGFTYNALGLFTKDKGFQIYLSKRDR